MNKTTWLLNEAPFCCKLPWPHQVGELTTETEWLTY